MGRENNEKLGSVPEKEKVEEEKKRNRLTQQCPFFFSIITWDPIIPSFFCSLFPPLLLRGGKEVGDIPSAFGHASSSLPLATFFPFLLSPP